MTWSFVPLGELVRVGMGQVDPRMEPFASAMHVGPELMKSGGGLSSQVKSARESDLTSGKYLFDADAILYAKIRPNLNKLAMPNFAGVCSADVYPLWAKDHADRGYLYQLMSSEWFVSEAVSRSFRTGIPKINRVDLLSIRVPVAPIAVQRKIADVLSSWDDAIEIASRAKDAAHGLRTWLRSDVATGRARLEGFQLAWRRVRLSELLHEHRAKSSPDDEVYSVSVHKGVVNQTEHLGRSFAASSTHHYNRVLPGDLVYTKSPTGSFPFGIIKQSEVSVPVVVSPLYGVFTPASRSLGRILHARFESPVVTRNYLGPLVQKGAKNTIAITNQRFLEGTVTVPSDPQEADAIAALLDDSGHQIALLDRKAELLREQKRGLLQKLLPGKMPSDDLTGGGL